MTSLLRPGGSTSAWRRLRLLVLNRDEWTCQVPVDLSGRATDEGPRCGVPLVREPCDAQAHVDHVVTRVDCERLGRNPDDPDNLRAACRLHNLQRSAQATNRQGAVPTSRAW